MADEIEGPGLPVYARLYRSGRYTRASVDPTHHGIPLTRLDAAAEWRQKAMLRQQMIADLIKERDALAEQLRTIGATHAK